MATEAEVEALRLMVGEPEDEFPYTNAALSTKIDEVGDLNLAAYNIWTEKASATAGLVNTSEGGSTRSMSDLHQNALRMAKHFSGMVSGGTSGDSPTATRIHKLRR